MAQVSSAATDKLVGILRADSGLAYSVAAVAARESLQMAPIPATQVVPENIAFEMAEKTAGAQYPVVYVYCERVVNNLREKFRTFSGKAHMAMDLRVTQDRLEGLERQLQLYVDAATQVLDAHRGDWGAGMFYTGGYEIQFGAVKHGGRHFIKTAKIVFEVDASLN